MDDERAKRVEERRRRMVGGIARTHEELDDFDIEFWQSLSPSDRFDAMFEMIYDQWWIKGGHGDPPRIRRTVGGVRPSRR